MGDGDGMGHGQTVGMPAQQHRNDLVAREPARILELAAVHLDLGRDRLGVSADHQRHRKRPWLRRKIGDAATGDPGLFAGLPAHRLFQRLAGLDESGTADQKETFLKDLSGGKITLDGGLPGRAFFAVLYENVMEGLFADPIYGGNKDKVGWKMIGFPGVLANNSENVKKYSDGKKFTADPVSIADMS
jgi:Gluconate 2-dehydrogenase subunit 3